MHPWLPRSHHTWVRLPKADFSYVKSFNIADIGCVYDVVVNACNMHVLSNRVYHPQTQKLPIDSKGSVAEHSDKSQQNEQCVCEASAGSAHEQEHPNTAAFHFFTTTNTHTVFTAIS